MSRASMFASPRPWVSPLLLGTWLSVAAVWQASVVQISGARMLWQPLLVLTLLVVTVIRSRDQRWDKAIGESLWIFLVMNVAAWLPFLSTTTYWKADYVYPESYGVYLLAYEGAIAALVGLQAGLTLFGRVQTWWVAGGWSKPLVVAPILLMIRSIEVGHWLTPLVGVALGLVVAAWRPPLWRSLSIHPGRVRRVLPVVVFVCGTALVFGAALRIYSLTGEGFSLAAGEGYFFTGEGYPTASDDGKSYMRMALAMAQEPSLFWTPKLNDDNFFSGYYPAMALWFMAVGPDMRSWLFWHGLAGGLLALVGYLLGRRLAGPVWGIVAAGLFVGDRVTLHLMATMNMETFFVPLLYLAVLLWVRAAEEAGPKALRLSLAAGLVLGLATIFRPTSALLPVALLVMLLLECSRHTHGQHARQALSLMAGFGLLVAAMIARHRIAWGYWTLAGVKGRISSGGNYALIVQGQHPAQIGLIPWLRLVADEPSVLWRTVIPGWWEQGLMLWTHAGFGQMDLIRGLNHEGPYQAAMRTVVASCMVVGAAVLVRRRTRLDLTILALPLYFTSLVLGWYVLNSRYRAPFIPALYLLACVGLAIVPGFSRLSPESKK